MDMEPPQIKAEVDDINLREKPAARALSDGSHEETPTPSYRHTWTVEQRLTLSMLAQSFSNDWDEKISVFNHFHKSQLPRGGFRSRVVYTQYRDMVSRRFDAAAASEKLKTTLSPYERSTLATEAALEKKAREIGVNLNVRGPTDTSVRSRMSDKHDVPERPTLKRKRADTIDDGRTDFLPDQPEDDSQKFFQQQPVYSFSLHPKTPTKANAKQGEGLLTPPDSGWPKRQRLTANKRLAQIGFRALTTQSQGTYSSTLGIRGELLIVSSKTFAMCQSIQLARSSIAQTFHSLGTWMSQLTNKKHCNNYLPMSK